MIRSQREVQRKLSFLELSYGVIPRARARARARASARAMARARARARARVKARARARARVRTREAGGGQNRFMECPNAKAYMVYPEDFGIKILNSLTKYTRQFKKANHENWYNRSY